MADQQSQAYEYGLSILSVKMSVKFPCKMKLQYNGTGITSEAASTEGQKFVFNQQVTLKEDNNKAYFQISVNLITEKGGKYIAGILKLFQNQLTRSEGQRIVIPLAKCLDSDAFCELRVDQVHATKQVRKSGPPIYRSRVNEPLDADYGSGQKLKPNYLGGQTRSQYQFPANNQKLKNDWQEVKSRQNAVQSYYNRNAGRSPNRSPTKVRSPFKGRQQLRAQHLNGRIDVDNHEGDNRDKLIQAEVYKEGYNKLKEKYKKQAENAKNQLNKRISMQSAQNNLKLEIMRLKLRSQEQQKTIADKNLKLKQLQNQISSYQKKELDMGYLREEINNKEHTLRMLQENIRTLTRDNQQLKTIGNQRAISEQEKTKEIKRELDLLKQTSESHEMELQRELKAKTEALFVREADLYSKTELLSREKKSLEDLQRQTQNKTLQFEKILQNQKSHSRSKLDEFRAKVQKLEKNLVHLEEEKSELQVEYERTKTTQVKAEYENRVLIQETDLMKTELAGMRAYKEKYSEIFRDHKLLLDDKNNIQKQLDRALQSKEISTSELSKQHTEQIQYFRKTNKELDEKQRNLASRVIELEGNLQASRSNQEKLKRSLDSINAELGQMRDKEKTLKKSFKTKEQETLSLQNQLTSSKQKNKSSQHFFRHELDKYKQELDKAKSDFQGQSAKNTQLNEQNGQLSVQLGKLKVKLQFTEEKVEKDASDMREKKVQIQSIIKDYELQLTSLTDTIQSLRNNQKELISKMQKQEIEGLKSQERIERQSKQIKILQEKHTFAENLLKNRQNQSSVLQTGKKDLELRSYKMQEELSSLKAEQSQLIAEKNKNQKMIELMQDQNNKLRKENERLKQAIEEKEKSIDQLHNDIKKTKEDITKADIKLNTALKDFQRFKETTAEGLNNSFSALLADRKVPQQQFTSNSNHLNRRSINQMVNNSQNANLEINNLILSYSKETKIALSKLTEQNRQLVRQKQKLQDELAGNINRGQTSEYQYSQQIQQLQAQLATAYAVRDEEGIKFDHILKDLNARLRDKDREIADLNSQIDEVNFNFSSAKNDNDNQLEQQSKKAAMLKSRILELEEKVEFLNMNIMNMEEKIHEQDIECEGVKGALRVERQNGNRKQRVIMQFQQRRDELEQQIQEGKRYRKDLLEKNSTLQLLLNTEREHMQKLRQLLEDEEQTGMELKTFIGSLMKQKEAVIKNQLQKSEQMIVLEGTILELERDRDIFSEEVNQLRKYLQDSKDTSKKFSINTRQLETKLTEERVRYQKTVQKLKQKEKELINKQEIIQKLQAKILRLNERGQKEGNQLRQQLQNKTEQVLALSKEHSQRCFQFDKSRHAYETQITQLRTELMNMEEEIFNLKHGHQTRLDQINSLNGQIAQLRLKINNLQMTNHDLAEEIRQKQQTAFQISGKLYNLEMKLEAKESEKNEKLSSIDNDWACKYESVCEEYQQRIEAIQKQRDYYKDRIHDQEDELKKIINQRHLNDIQDGKMKGILQQKIRQLEDDRLHVISQKNSQIQKVNEENKMNFESLKNRQSQNRKVLHELEVTRTTVSKLELRNKEIDDKMKNISKVYQAQIQQLKKKQSLHKNFKESVSNKIWNSERQVRRVVQTFIKKAMQSLQDSRTSHKFIEVMKGFEQNVSDAMRINVDDTR